MGLLIATLYLKVYDSNQMGSTFDPNKFKMDQREGWNSVAEGWKEWWEPIEKGGEISQRLIELAEIKPGHRVLDIATGIGEPSITGSESCRKRRSYFGYRYFKADASHCKRKTDNPGIAKHN